MLDYAGTAVAIGVPPIPAEVDARLERHAGRRLPAQGVPADHRRRRPDPVGGLPGDGAVGAGRPLDLDGMVTGSSASRSSTRRSARCSPAR